MTPITEGFAGAVAAEYFGVTAPVRALPGEFDRNFELAPPDGQGFILKFSHPDTSDSQLDYQNALMAHLAGLPVPRLLLNRRGDAVTSLPSGARARMLTRLPGRRLADVAPRPPALLNELGALLGRLDRELQTFDHPAMHREWLWDLTLAAEVIRPRLLFVPQPDRAAVAEALKRFESSAAPVLPDLPGQAIHNDANDYNVLVVPEGTGWKISGLVDFGDSLYAPRVCEVAIAAAYALLGEKDPPAAAQAVAQGY